MSHRICKRVVALLLIGQTMLMVAKYYFHNQVLLQVIIVESIILILITPWTLKKCWFPSVVLWMTGVVVLLSEFFPVVRKAYLTVSFFPLVAGIIMMIIPSSSKKIQPGDQ